MPNPFEYLVFQTRIQPQAKAIQQLNGAITFEQLLAVVRKTASKLRKAGVVPGQVVVTCLPERLGWIMTLALLHEAAISCSNHGYAAIEKDIGVDLVITNRPLPDFPAERTILVDADWLNERREESITIEPNSYASADSICRLILTSGTTGEKKAVPFSIAVLRARLDRAPTYWSSSGSEINMMPLCTIGGFVTALYRTFSGAPLYFYNSMEDLVALLQKFRVASLIGSPAQLAMLVKFLQDQSIKLASLTTVRYAGSPVSPLLLEQFLSKLCPSVINIYGSTEVGGVCAEQARKSVNDAITAGYPLPTIDVEVVDELGHLCGLEQDGLIRTKSPSMATEYFRNPEETRKFFKEGWFYPGDRGRRLADGLLILSGRESEIINCGGVKIDPAQLDHVVVSFKEVIDAAVFAIDGKSGLQEVAAALVVPDDFDLNALHAALLKSLGPLKTPKQYFRVTEIPRNQMGKVLRAQIANAIARDSVKLG